MKAVALAFISALCLTRAAFAQDLLGTWKGSIGEAKRVLVVSKVPGEGLRGELYSLNAVWGNNVNLISAITVHGKDVSFDLDRVPGTFTGTISADQKSIVGSWKDDGPAQPLILERAFGNDARIIDPSPHKVQFVTVDKDVRLEVLDWGGNGPPIVFLAGLGDTAHVFDTLAPHFTAKHHVYGITRRGAGASDIPAPTDANYDANRLGDDVLAVMNFFKLQRPILVGHSIAGEELSSIGTRHPEKIGGLIYLDAAYGYAFYDQSGDHRLDVNFAELRRLMGQLDSIGSKSAARALVQEIEATMEQMKPGLKEFNTMADDLPDVEPETAPLKPSDYVEATIIANEHKFGPVSVPTLVLTAVPRRCGDRCNDARVQLIATLSAAQADAFERATPTAHVVRLPNAEHSVWVTNEADVLREMNAFLDGLNEKAPPP